MFMYFRKSGFILLVTFIAVSGCGNDFPLDKQSRDTISAPKSWKISSARGGFVNLEKAIDGDPKTSAVSAGRYEGASFTLDLGRLCYFNMIVLIHGKDEMGFAGKVSVSTSSDGMNFAHVHTQSGTRKYTYLSLLTPVTARYVRFTAVAQGSRPWSIGGIYIE